MIYWPREAEEFTMRFPNPLGYTPADGDPALWLEIRNNVGLQVYATGMEPDEITPLYFVKTGSGWTVPEEAADGEYTYTLRLGAGGIVLSQGLLIVGDYKGDREQYETSVNYEQYGQN